ncbi:MAG TPA: hypothetical protein VFX03_04800, partial [Thermomicrobiales bacterium]|nr:hypothetical protein [Thermomicrobiales bacterium]
MRFGDQTLAQRILPGTGRHDAANEHVRATGALVGRALGRLDRLARRAGKPLDFAAQLVHPARIDERLGDRRAR